MSQHDERPPRRSGSGGNGATRRDFLGMLGAALGGISLAGCGGSGGASLDTLHKSAVPGGWGFSSLLDVSRAVDLSDIAEFTPNMMINRNGQVVFYAITRSGFGIFEADTTTRGARRSVTALRPIVKTGQAMSDGRIAGRIASVDLNNQGTIGVIIQPPIIAADGQETLKQEAGGVYLSRGGGAPEPILGAMDTVPGKHAHLGGVFGDLDVSDGDNVLVTGYYVDEDVHENREGLFYLPAGHNPRLEVSTGDVVPGSNQTITSLGLVDAGMEGTDYALMAGASDTENSHDIELNDHTRGVPQVDDVYRRAGSMVLGGNTGHAKGPSRLVQASRNIRSTRSADLTGGVVYLGARQGTVGAPVTAYVEHLTDSQMELRLNGQTIVATNRNTPLGHNIVSLGAPVIGGGLVYYTAYTQEGIEIIATNGELARTVITTGAMVEGDEVKNLVLGFHPDQVNDDSTILIYTEMRSGAIRYIEGVPV